MMSFFEFINFVIGVFMGCDVFKDYMMMLLVLFSSISSFGLMIFKILDLFVSGICLLVIYIMVLDGIFLYYMFMYWLLEFVWLKNFNLKFLLDEIKVLLFLMISVVVMVFVWLEIFGMNIKKVSMKSKGKNLICMCMVVVLFFIFIVFFV